MNILKRAKHIKESLVLHRKKLFKIVIYEIFNTLRYSKENHFFEHEHSTPSAYYFIHKISQFINKKKCSRIIDLGCGTGRVINYLNNKTSAKIYGYENDVEIYNLAIKNKKKETTIKLEDMINADFDKIDADCFILNDPLYKAEQRLDFEKLINKIHQSKKRLSKKYYIIGINLDADERYKAEDRNYIFFNKNLIKVVEAGPNKKIKFFEF